jgi:hypothetical protein
MVVVPPDFNSTDVLFHLLSMFMEQNHLHLLFYADSIKALWLTFLAGGDCAEDLNEHLKDDLLAISGLKVPSSNTVLWHLKKWLTYLYRSYSQKSKPSTQCQSST